MVRFMCRRFRTIIIMVLFCLSLLYVQVKAGPGSTFIEAQTIDAHSILVTWSDDPLAEGYRVFRNNFEPVADVEVDVNEYLDTGLENRKHYYYRVASLIGGEVKLTDQISALAWTVDAPAEVTPLSWYTEKDSNNKDHLVINLTWTPVEDVDGYEVFARIGDIGEYSDWRDTIENNLLAGFFPEEIETRYWFKVRARVAYYLLEDNEYGGYFSAFSPEASITVPGFTFEQEDQLSIWWDLMKPKEKLDPEDFEISIPSKPWETLVPSHKKYLFKPTSNPDNVTSPPLTTTRRPQLVMPITTKPPLSIVTPNIRTATPEPPPITPIIRAPFTVTTIRP